MLLHTAEFEACITVCIRTGTEGWRIRNRGSTKRSGIARFPFRAHGGTWAEEAYPFFLAAPLLRSSVHTSFCFRAEARCRATAERLACPCLAAHDDHQWHEPSCRTNTVTLTELRW